MEQRNYKYGLMDGYHGDENEDFDNEADDEFDRDLIHEHD